MTHTDCQIVCQLADKPVVVFLFLLLMFFAVVAAK